MIALLLSLKVPVKIAIPAGILLDIFLALVLIKII